VHFDKAPTAFHTPEGKIVPIRPPLPKK